MVKKKSTKVDWYAEFWHIADILRMPGSPSSYDVHEKVKALMELAKKQEKEIEELQNKCWNSHIEQAKESLKMKDEIDRLKMELNFILKFMGEKVEGITTVLNRIKAVYPDAYFEGD